ncbi:hypothetical protein KIM67_13370 [Flagellimonas sp. 389]|uniref:hypothetical protein n=1 Tax=Flagellimonas sp. 389 TaxID=2835862 RepID=UPI001BD288B4|nr:hypothetical protein [Flagellimonas sp. 389]MBS9463402.1 hypothetical protein [Flagellimonas sp. 389]
MDYISLSISLAILTISGLTFWLSRIKKGTVKMTRPTMIYFGVDSKGQKKIGIRTLLYSTSEKGKYVQYMYVQLQRRETVQNFNVWSYKNNGLVLGSGLFVNKTGVSCDHSFLLPKDGTHYTFLSGDYVLQVFIEAIDEKPKKIFEQRLLLTPQQQEAMELKNGTVYFNWAPNTQNYFSHIVLG